MFSFEFIDKFTKTFYKGFKSFHITYKTKQSVHDNIPLFELITEPYQAKRGGRVAKASGRESRGPGFDSRRRQLLRVTGP